MSNNINKLLDVAMELRKTAFYQSPHWSHSPTQKEKAYEDNLIQECNKNYHNLTEIANEIRDLLLNPFFDPS